MADPLSIFSTLQTIITLALSISGLLEKSSDNKEECRRLHELMDRVTAIAKDLLQKLKPTANIVENRNSSMGVAFMGLQKVLERGRDTVQACQKKKGLLGTMKAKEIAEKLREVKDDISTNLMAAIFATAAYHISISDKTNESVDAIRADVKDMKGHLDALQSIRAVMEDFVTAVVVGASRRDAASNCSTLAKHSSQIDIALPGVQLPREAEELVQTYRTLTGYASYYQNKDKMSSEVWAGLVGLVVVVVGCYVKWLGWLGWLLLVAGLVEQANRVIHSRASRASSSGGSANKSTSVKSVTGKGGPTSTVNKPSSSSSSKSVEIMEPGETSSITEIIRERATKNGTILRPIEVHPKKTWVVMTSEVGGLVIWDYQEETELHQVKYLPGHVHSAKFIVQMKWLVVGTGDGSTYIYCYTGTGELGKPHSFKAYDGCSKKEIKDYANKAIKSLAFSVHPSKLSLLLAFGCWIMQWQYLRKDNKWERNRKIQLGSAVRSLKYNPRGGADTFVIVTRDNKAKIYTTEPSNDAPITLEGASSAHYYPTGSNQHWMVTCQSESASSQIWDWKTKNVVRTLEVSGRKMVQVASHPTHQILATSTVLKDKDKRNTKNKGTCSTTSEDGIVYLWDANSDRPEKMVQIPGMGTRDHSMEFATDDRNGLTRLFVKFETEIAIVEVNLPVANTSQRTGYGYGRVGGKKGNR